MIDVKGDPVLSAGQERGYEEAYKRAHRKAYRGASEDAGMTPPENIRFFDAVASRLERIER